MWVKKTIPDFFNLKKEYRIQEQFWLDNPKHFAQNRIQLLDKCITGVASLLVLMEVILLDMVSRLYTVIMDKAIITITLILDKSIMGVIVVLDRAIAHIIIPKIQLQPNGQGWNSSNHMTRQSTSYSGYGQAVPPGYMRQPQPSYGEQ